MAMERMLKELEVVWSTMEFQHEVRKYKEWSIIPRMEIHGELINNYESFWYQIPITK